MNKVIIYTDGACSGNPGVGGWSAILICGKHTKRISGAEADTTNNKMELTAVVKALSCLKCPCEVMLHSDSAYVVNAFLQGWIESWIASGWRTSGRKPVRNQELWRSLIGLSTVHNVTFVKVKGHSDDKFNNECDALAKAAINNYKEFK